MDVAFDPGAWRDFYLMVGGAAAVLTGLIFVAVSVHLRAVLGEPWHRGRASSSLVALSSVVLLAAAALVPGQPVAWLGVETIVLAGAAVIPSVRALRHGLGRRGTTAQVEIVAGAVVAVIVALGGASLVLGTGPGLWLLVPGALVALGTALANAWRLMVDVAAEV